MKTCFASHEKAKVSDLVFTHYAPEAQNVYLEARTSLELIEWTEILPEGASTVGKKSPFYSLIGLGGASTLPAMERTPLLRVHRYSALKNAVRLGTGVHSPVHDELSPSRSVLLNQATDGPPVRIFRLGNRAQPG